MVKNSNHKAVVRKIMEVGMKKYFDPKEDCQYFVGKTKEIKSIYKSIARKECGIYPRFYGFPVFSEKRRFMHFALIKMAG